MSKDLSFAVLAVKGSARVGELITPHGMVPTPVFMPVGTAATVKSLTSEEVERSGAKILLANTYHLWLRPGSEVVHQATGLHSFMRWPRAILTDSGGYQVSSLGLFRSGTNRSPSVIDDEGVTFTSHIDGSKRRLTPEISITIQEQLGADIIMAFDEATPDKGKIYAREAMERTHRWLSRSKRAWLEAETKKKGRELPQTLFGIIQGGNYQDLRQESAQFVSEQNLPGIAIGGGSVGANMKETIKNVEWVKPYISNNIPFYAMGVATRPSEVVATILAGVDMFDCVAPTRWARTGYLYQGSLQIDKEDITKTRFVSAFTKERLPIDHRRFATDGQVIDQDCDCATCKHGYSRAYLHHLYRCRELTYYRLASVHNVRFMIRVVEQLRQAILSP